MRVRVNFRVNTETGEVEEFLIEDISTEPEPEHDAVHDRIAYEVGKVVERRAAPQQVVGAPGHDAPPLVYLPGEELPPVTEREEARE
jgi:FtsH ternary system-associated peptide